MSSERLPRQGEASGDPDTEVTEDDLLELAESWRAAQLLRDLSAILALWRDGASTDFVVELVRITVQEYFEPGSRSKNGELVKQRRRALEH